jgi:hypothetical protein
LEAKVAEARPTFEGEAEKFLSTIEAAKVRGSYVDPSLGRVTFGSYTEEFWPRPWTCVRVPGRRTRPSTGFT